MNTRPTERLYPSSQRSSMDHIDLTRRLPSLKSSLTPGTVDPRPWATPPRSSLPALLTLLLILAAIAALFSAHL